MRKTNEKGITLVALIITIIILLILAVITISQLKDNGLLGNAQYAVDESKKTEIEEQIKLAVLASYGTDGKIDNNLLKENLNKIKGIEKIEDIVYPLTAKVEGYEFKISENGNVTYNGEIKIADGTVESSRGIEPSGIIDITENGKYDVTNYATANVSVPVNTPSGTKEIMISANNIDVSSYQYADTSSLYTQSDYTNYGTSQYTLGYNTGVTDTANENGYKSGMFSPSTTGTTFLECGFKPKYISILVVKKSDTDNPMSIIYDEQYSTTKSFKYYSGLTAWAENTMEGDNASEYAATDHIYLVNDTGFGYYFSSSNKNIYWTAYK